MKMLNTLTSSAYHDLIDYNVVDQSGDHVGSLHSLWSDQNTGALEFLGVKTGWLFGKNHVVPASQAQIDEDNRFVQIPFAADFIKEAPSIAADAEITEDQEAEIYRYYGLSGATGASTTTTTSTEATTINDLGRTGAAAATTGAAFASTGATASTTDYAATSTTGTAGATREAQTGETIEVPISEEQLRVGKREVDAGSMRLRKVIRTEVVNQPVELRREEVIVERIPAGEVRATGTTAFEGEDIVVPVSREEAVISKETVVTGAVRVNKTSETETQTVSDTVRKEDVVVDRGNVGVTHGSTAATTSTTGYEPTGTGFAATGNRTGTEFGGSTTSHSGDANPDLITGEPGSHPVGTAIGGVSGAATGAALGGAGAMATGAAFGAAAGPIGAVIGGVAGAVVGGLVGKGVEEHFDPTEEAAYWQENYRSSAGYDPSMSYEEYEPAYRSGYTGFGKYHGTGKRFDEVEGDIRRDYEGSGAKMGYDKARDSVKAAYERLFNRASGGQR